MKIQLNKGQMAELLRANQTANEVPNAVDEDENPAHMSGSLGEVEARIGNSTSGQSVVNGYDTRSPI